MRKDVYHPPTVTVDGVIFQVDSGKLTVLLIKRAQEPFKGEWALPGGYSAAGETTQAALNRILIAKTGVLVGQFGVIEQLYTFDSVARDPRGHAVSIVYMGLVKKIEPGGRGGTQTPQFFPIDELPKLAYDHDRIIAYAHEQLRAKLSYTNIAFALLPYTFTLTELQTTYEAVLGVALDKRNFRKKFLSLGLAQETVQMSRDGAHRPARLYVFRAQELETLPQNFN